MDVKFLDKSGNVTDNKKVSDTVFSREYSESLVHQLVESFRANSRGGNRAQKDRSEVKFSTRKPWKQKGTGRARAGRASSPIWRSGGKVFPSSPTENFTKKVNKKMYKAAMQCIFSQLVREDRLFIISEPGVSEPKTKQMVNELQGYKGNKRLIISKEVKEVSELASRNIQNLKFINCSKVDPLVLLNADFTYVSEAALEKIEESLL